MRDPGFRPPPDSRNPDTVFLLALLLTAGAAQFATGAESGSVEALVPTWVLTAWSVLLTLASAVTLLGVCWRSRVSGILIEAVGRVMLGPACLAYAIAVVVAAGIGGSAQVAGLLLGLCLSSAWRVVQIYRGIDAMRRTMSRISDRQDAER